MSGNVSTRSLDRRVFETREALGDALIELMQKKPFDSITVQQVLDRAGVSRSTFYTHYRDKNDLFLSDVEDFLQWLGTLLTRSGAPAARLAPVRELFAHVGDAPAIGDAIDASGKRHDFTELAQGHFARSIEARLIAAQVPLDPVLLKAQSHALAGSLLSLLDWWRARDPRPTPEQVDELFHRMAWNGLPAPARR